MVLAIWLLLEEASLALLWGSACFLGGWLSKCIARSITDELAGTCKCLSAGLNLFDSLLNELLCCDLCSYREQAEASLLRLDRVLHPVQN